MLVEDARHLLKQDEGKGDNMKRLIFILLFMSMVCGIEPPTLQHSQFDGSIAGWYKGAFYVPNGTVYSEGLIVVDEGTLAGESLSEVDFATHAKWDVTNDFDDSGGNAAFVWSANQTSMLTQIQANLVIAGVDAVWYLFTYTVAVTTAFDGNGAATITPGFASNAISLDLSAGTHSVYFKSKTTPVDFVISIVSGTDTEGTFTIDNVTLKEIQGGDVDISGTLLVRGIDIGASIALTTQVTKVLYVDVNRVDSYTENGSIVTPYKTIQSAIAVASGNVLLNVAPGEYAGDIDLGLNVVSIRGSGINATFFTGNMTAGDRAHSLEEFHIKSTGSLTITDNIFAQNLHLQCAVVVSGTGFLEGKMLLIQPVSGVVPLTVSSTGGVVLTGSSVIAEGNIHAINQSAGAIVLFHSYVANSSPTTVTINSSGGVCGLIDMTIGNAGIFGGAINMNNSGVALQANTLEGISCSGDIACGTATTYVEGLNFVGFGSLSGFALIYRSASRIGNDSGVAGATVKDALDALAGGSTDDQKIDVFSGAVNTISISLEDDGEVNKTLDISGFTAIADNTAKNTNVPTALSIGTVGVNTVAITSDGGADDVTLPAALVGSAGMLTTAKWAEIVANNAKVGVTTELKNVVEDLSPQLGAGLDIQAFNITGTGFWNAGTVAFGKGGTGLSSWTQYLIPYAATTTSFGQIAIGNANDVLTSGGVGVAPSFQAPAGGGDFSDGGEVGGADRTLGNTDAFALGFETTNVERAQFTAAGHFVPIGTHNYDLGSAGADWNNAYFGTSYSGTAYFDGLLIHTNDADTRINFTTDKIQYSAGGIEFITMTEGATDVFSFCELSDIDISSHAFDYNYGNYDWDWGTNVRAHFGANATETHNAKTVTYNSGTTTLYCDRGNYQFLTFGAGNITTLDFADMIANEVIDITLVIIQDGTGSRVVSAWDAAIDWEGGTAPTLTMTANSADVLNFIVNGTGIIYGKLLSADVR